MCPALKRTDGTGHGTSKRSYGVAWHPTVNSQFVGLCTARPFDSRAVCLGRGTVKEELAKSKKSQYQSITLWKPEQCNIYKISFGFVWSKQNHENQKALSFIASKVPSSLDCIILWYCANNPLFYLLIVKKAADFIACFYQCLCPSSVCLLPPPFTWI